MKRSFDFINDEKFRVHIPYRNDDKAWDIIMSVVRVDKHPNTKRCGSKYMSALIPKIVNGDLHLMIKKVKSTTSVHTCKN